MGAEVEASRTGHPCAAAARPPPHPMAFHPGNQLAMDEMMMRQQNMAWHHQQQQAAAARVMTSPHAQQMAWHNGNPGMIDPSQGGLQNATPCPYPFAARGAFVG